MHLGKEGARFDSQAALVRGGAGVTNPIWGDCARKVGHPIKYKTQAPPNPYAKRIGKRYPQRARAMGLSKSLARSCKITIPDIFFVQKRLFQHSLAKNCG